MTSKKLIKMIEKDGWYLRRVEGSHHHFKHPNKDLDIKTVNSILKQTGLK